MATIARSKSVKSLNAALSAFNGLQNALYNMSDCLDPLLKQAKGYDFRIDQKGALIRVFDKWNDNQEIPADDSDLILARSYCEYLPKYVEDVIKYQAAAQQALRKIPNDLLAPLDSGARSSWHVSVLADCIDRVGYWPGSHQRIPSAVNSILTAAAEHPPFDTWNQYRSLLERYQNELFALRFGINGQPANDDKEKISYLEDDLDLAIRQYFAERATRFNELDRQINEIGKDGARDAANKLFGRQAIEIALRVKSPSKISENDFWKEKAGRLGLTKIKRLLRDEERFDIGEEKKAESMQANQSEPSVLSEQAAIAGLDGLVDEGLSIKERDALIDAIHKGTCTPDDALEMGRTLLLNRESRRSSRRSP